MNIETVTAEIADLEQKLAAKQALLYRLDAYETLKQFPDDHTVSTLVWNDEARPDGTFDVALNIVYDDAGAEADHLPGVGAVGAGWIDERASAGYRTAFDAWREDSTNAESDIVIAKVHRWHDALTAAAPTCASCGAVVDQVDLDNGCGAVWVDGAGSMHCYDDDSAGRHEPSLDRS